MANQTPVTANSFKEFQDLRKRAELAVTHRFTITEPRKVPGGVTDLAGAKAAARTTAVDARDAFENGMNIVALGIQKQLTDHGISDETALKFLRNHVAWLVLVGTGPDGAKGKEQYEGMVLDLPEKAVINREIVKLESIKSIFTRIINGEHSVFDSEALSQLVPEGPSPKAVNPKEHSGPK